MSTDPLTILLNKMSQGDDRAGEQLFERLYADLRSRAGGMMSGRAENTLQPTAVVNEAWLKIAASPETDWNSRGHFLGVAAKAMRSVLVDHARAKRASKRGGSGERVPLDDALAMYEERAIDLLALDAALERLAESDAELARLVELRFFSGLTIPETAQVLKISTATVERSWRTARSLLRVELGAFAPDEP